MDLLQLADYETSDEGESESEVSLSSEDSKKEPLSIGVDSDSCLKFQRTVPHLDGNWSGLIYISIAREAIDQDHLTSLINFFSSRKLIFQIHVSTLYNHFLFQYDAFVKFIDHQIQKRFAESQAPSYLS